MSDRPPEEQGVPATRARTRRLLVGGLGAVAALIAAALVVAQLVFSHSPGNKAVAPVTSATPTAAGVTVVGTPGGQASPATATAGAGGAGTPSATRRAPSATATARRIGTRPAGARTADPTSVPVGRSTPAGANTVPLTAGPAVPTIGNSRPGHPAKRTATPTASVATALPAATPGGEKPPTRVVGPAHTAVAAPGPSAVVVPTRPPLATRAPVATIAPLARPTAPAPTTVVAPTRAPVATSVPVAVAPPTRTARPPVVPPVGATLAAAHRGYKAGAYYFSGWSHGQNDNISTILTGSHPGAEPLIGWYDDSQAQVDKSIGQAADAGIDFLSFDWYDTPYSPYATDRTLNEGLRYYLTSSRRPRIGFNLVFVDHAPFVPTPDHPQAIAAWRTTEWPKIVDKWLPLFKQPDYVRVDGKPLLIVFSPEHMREICGDSAGVRAALDYLRVRARAAGLPGVTVAIAATVAEHSNPIKVGELNVEGYDAATGYNYHSMGHEQYRTPVPYSTLVDENEATWNRVARAVHVPYIPVITSGWDQRYSAREQQTAIIYDGRTPAQFACYAVRARHWVDAHPAQTTKERIVMVFAWNEIGEGGAIIPNHQDGSAYANIVGSVFGTAATPPATPPDCR